VCECYGFCIDPEILTLPTAADLSPRRPTLETVARALGVSRMTVSNAYNKPDQLSAQTRDAVLAMARSLGYSGPSAAARSLRRGMSGTVGVLPALRVHRSGNDRVPARSGRRAR
jgi:hypothetical protein